jgi:signal transduction histidine kinase
MTSATEAVRRRIERDLHDGTQQRLVSVLMSLALADAKLPREPDDAKRIVARARDELAAALEELRDLIEGIHPPVLAERGLSAALEDLAERAPLTIHLELAIGSRPPADVEAAAYFVASEALCNTVKHSEAQTAWVRAWGAGDVVFVEVTDDGIGGADPTGGCGLRGLMERVQALCGRLAIVSRSGCGTTVRAEIPCA